MKSARQLAKRIGGHMKAVFACLISIIILSAAFASDCPKEDFKQKLNAIGFKDLTSITQATDEVVKIAKNQPDKCRDELISAYRDYYLENMVSYVMKIPSDLTEKSAAKLDKELAKAGWRTAMTEGAYYVAQAGGWMEIALKEILTPAYKDFLEQESKENREGFADDAGLVISWEQLRVRIIEKEALLKKHPDFIENQLSQDHLTDAVGAFLGGLPNTPIYDFETKALLKDVKIAYEKFIKENKTSKYYTIVNDFYEMLRKNKFVVPDNYAEYLIGKGVTPY
jgi:hypothetical protein